MQTIQRKTSSLAYLNNVHKSITSAVPLDCNKQIKLKLVDFMAACTKLGMANSKGNILYAMPLWQAGYSPEATVRFFGIKEPMPEPVAVQPKRISKSVDKQTFMDHIMSLAKTGRLVVDSATTDSASFSYEGRLVGAIITVNKQQDRLLFYYEH